MEYLGFPTIIRIRSRLDLGSILRSPCLWKLKGHIDVLTGDCIRNYFKDPFLHSRLLFCLLQTLGQNGGANN